MASLTVNGLSGKEVVIIEVPFPEATTIGELKTLVEKATEIPLEEQRLIWGAAGELGDLEIAPDGTNEVSLARVSGLSKGLSTPGIRRRQLLDVHITRGLSQRGFTQVCHISRTATRLRHQSGRMARVMVVHLQSESALDSHLLDLAIDECQRLQLLRHPNIVRLEAHFLAGNTLCVLTGDDTPRTLECRIYEAREERTALLENDILSWLAQALAGLGYMHRQNIAHGGLRAEFLLLYSNDHTLRLQLTPLCRLESHVCLRHAFEKDVFEYSCTPPEWRTDNLQVAPKFASDIWLLGVVLYYLCELVLPPLSPLHVSNSRAIQIEACYAKEVRDLFRQMVQWDHRRRPAAADLLNRPCLDQALRRSSTSPGEPLRYIEPLRYSAFRRGEPVEYFSISHSEWLPHHDVHVAEINQDGAIRLNVKPNTWLSPAVQAIRVRRPCVERIRRKAEFERTLELFGTAAKVADASKLKSSGQVMPSDVAQLPSIVTTQLSDPKLEATEDASPNRRFGACHRNLKAQLKKALSPDLPRPLQSSKNAHVSGRANDEERIKPFMRKGPAALVGSVPAHRQAAPQRFSGRSRSSGAIYGRQGKFVC